MIVRPSEPRLSPRLCKRGLYFLSREGAARCYLIAAGVGQPVLVVGRAEVYEARAVCSEIALVAEAGGHHVADLSTQATGDR